MNICSKCPPPAHTHDLRWSHHWSTAASVMFWSKSNEVCIKCFRKSSTLWIFVSYTQCCLTPLISKVGHMMTVANFGKAVIHLMQFSLVISHCNITFSVFWLSHGIVATLIRWGGWTSYRHIWRSLISLTLKTLLVHGQVTIIFVVSVGLFVCAEFFSAVFDPISIKLGHMLYVWV